MNVSKSNLGQLKLSAFYESDTQGFLDDISEYYKELKELVRKRVKISTICFFCSLIYFFLAVGIVWTLLSEDDVTLKNIFIGTAILACFVCIVSLLFVLNILFTVFIEKSRQQSKMKQSMSRKNITSYRSIFNFYEYGVEIDTPSLRRVFSYNDRDQFFYTDKFFTIIFKPKIKIIIPIEKMGEAGSDTLKKFIGAKYYWHK